MRLSAQMLQLFAVSKLARFSFIGAGSVVTHSVADYALVFGNPAIQNGWMSERGVKLLFDEKGIAVCSESGERYELKNGAVNKVVHRD